MKANKALWMICGLALLIKLVMLCCYSQPQGDDGLRYLRTGMNLADSGVLSTDGYGNMGFQPDPQPTAHDLPLYPALLAGIYCCTGSPYATQRIAVALNIVFAFIALVFLLQIVRGEPFNGSSKQQNITAAVFLFMPESIQYSMCHMPDMIAVMFCVIAIWAYYKSVYSKIGWIFVAAIEFSAASYSKPICIPLSLAILISRLIYNVERPDAKRFMRIAGCVVLALIVYIGLFAPWYLRNARVYGTGGISTIAGTNLFHDNLGRYVGSISDESERNKIRSEMQQVAESVRGKDLMTQANIKATFAKQTILDHFIGYTIWTLKTHPRLYAGCGLAALFHFMGYESASCALQGPEALRRAGRPVPVVTMTDRVIAWSVQIVAWGIMLSMYALALLGVIYGFRAFILKSEKFGDHMGYLLPVLSFVLLAAVIGPIVTTRYRFIMIPFLSILAGLTCGNKSVTMQSK